MVHTLQNQKRSRDATHDYKNCDPRIMKSRRSHHDATPTYTHQRT